MARWRDIKKNKNTNKQDEKINDQKQEPMVANQSCSPLFRLKAFITDMFMIMMPIMYLTTYVILDGKDSFQSNESAHWITMALYGAITVAFWVLKGQTPGFKAYDLMIVNDTTKQKLGVVKAILRYIMYLVSVISIIGIIIPFFRKDKKTLQDLVMGTSVIVVPRENN